jgi:type IV fimbrial biogenesis protein FimT
MSRARGFTLIETMVVLTVAGIVIAIAVPAFSGYRESLALRQARSQLEADLRQARQLAITRRVPVVVRFGTPPATTDILQYTLHLDSDNDRVVDAGESVRRAHMPSGTRLASVSLAPTDTVAFDISGILWPGHGGGRLVFANRRGRADTLMVSAAGIVYRP